MTQMAGAAAPDRRLCPLGRGACRRRVGGFTLVELLVALAAMALLSAMAWRGIDAMGRAQSSTQAFGADVQALQAGLGQWTSDLDAVAVMPAVTAIDFDGHAPSGVTRGSRPRGGARIRPCNCARAKC